MKSYLFDHYIVGAGGSRNELYVPGVGIFWTDFGKIITDPKSMDEMQERVNIIHKWKSQNMTFWKESVPNYKLLREKNVPKHLLKDVIGWVKSEKISKEGREESEERLMNLYKIKSKNITIERIVKNMRNLYKHKTFPPLGDIF